MTRVTTTERENEMTELKCPDCHAEIGEWCFDMVARYTMPPYDHRKVYRGGALLTHLSRQQKANNNNEGK